MEIKPGDRVQHIGQKKNTFGTGTAIKKCGKKSFYVKRDKFTALGRPTISSLEVIANDQPTQET